MADPKTLWEAIEQYDVAYKKVGACLSCGVPIFTALKVGPRQPIAGTDLELPSVVVRCYCAIFHIEPFGTECWHDLKKWR